MLGHGDDDQKRAAYLEVMERTFVAASPGSKFGIQDPLKVRKDRFEIAGSVVTWGADHSKIAIDFMDETLRLGHWGVLIFHDIVETGTGALRDTSRSVHDEIIRYAVSRQFWIAPFRDVYRHIISKNMNVHHAA